MPYADNNGVKIYYEVEGQGPPLLMAHGAGPASSSNWRRYGYVDALKGDFQLILYDARGHGRSDKPHEASAYGLNWVDDALAVLDHAGISKANYYGYSMGAWVGYWLAARHAERFGSFILGCVSPYGITESQMPLNAMVEGFRLLLTDPTAAVSRRERVLKLTLTPDERNWMLTRGTEVLRLLLAEPAAAVALQEKALGRSRASDEKHWLLSLDPEVIRVILVDPAAAVVPQERILGRTMTFEERSWMITRDIEAFIAVITSVAGWPNLTNQDLAAIEQPCLVYCGSADPLHAAAQEAATHLPNARFISLRGLDHGAAWMRSDLVLPHIKEFLAKVSKK